METDNFGAKENMQKQWGETKSKTAVYTKSVARGYSKRSDKFARIYRLVYGWA